MLVHQWETEIDACRAVKIYELNGSKLNIASETGNTVPLKGVKAFPLFTTGKDPFVRGA